MNNLIDKKYGNIIGKLCYKDIVTDSIITFFIPIEYKEINIDLLKVIIDQAKKINIYDVDFEHLALNLRIDIYKDAEPRIETELQVLLNDRDDFIDDNHIVDTWQELFISIDISEEMLKDIIFNCITA